MATRIIYPTGKMGSYTAKFNTAGSGINDGETFTINYLENFFGPGVPFRVETFEFDKNASVTPGNHAVTITDGMTAAQLAAALKAAMETALLFGYVIDGVDTSMLRCYYGEISTTAGNITIASDNDTTDWDIINNAVNGSAGSAGSPGTYATPAADGDVILLKARASGDGPGDPVTPWKFAKVNTFDGPTAIVSASLGSEDFNGDYLGASNLQVGIEDKNITLIGEIDGNGDPETVIDGYWIDGNTEYLKQINQMHTPYAYWNFEQQVGGGFAVGNSKTIRFENLSFYHVGQGIIGYAPVEVVNCEFDYCSLSVHSIKDSAYTNTTLIDRVKVSNCEWRPLQTMGNNILVQNCELTGLSAEWTPYAAQMGAQCLPDIIFGWAGGFLGYGAYPEHKNVTVVGCSIDYSESVATGYGCIEEGDNYAASAVVEDIEIRGNTLNIQCIYGPIWLAYNGRGGITRACTATDNVLTDSGSPYGYGNIMVYGARGPVTDSLISNNTINTAAYGPGVFMLGASSCSLVKNDYTNSGLPTVELDSSVSCVFMYYCDHCLVFETGGFPAGQGGAKNHVTDLMGYSNRIVGESANTVEKPAGIGQYRSSVAQQKFVEKEARTKRHDDFMKGDHQSLTK